MISLSEAQQRILACVAPLPAETVPVGGALNRYLAEAIVSPVDLPLFDNSAMDGYAVRSEDTAQACEEQPVELRLIGQVPAGTVFNRKVTSGACVRIFTGSPLPPGVDAVIMQEDVRLDPKRPDRIWIGAPVEAEENIRQRGRDVRQGDRIVEAGRALTVGRLSLLAAAGIDRVAVGRRPRLALLATGSELREPGQPLSGGQIYESNRAGLAAAIRLAGGEPVPYPLIPDDLEATRQALDRALTECDAAISTGGVSVGDHDWVKTAFEAIGGEWQFWRVAMKPGKPFAFGRRGGQLLFGLPGNPASALVTFALLARPAILAWQGARDWRLPAQAATLAEPVANEGPRPHFLRVRLDDAGRVFVRGLQASDALFSMAESNALLEVPPETAWPAGAAVRVTCWP